jgi:N,N'-diacetyllegionaminate synthase
LLYVGALTLAEIERAVAICRDAGNEQIILQHGFQAYPTPLEDNRLGYIRTLKEAFDVPVAFGDHTDGGDPMALIVPLLGIAQGANLIEKHLTHDRGKQGVDYQSALDPADFIRFVELVKQTYPCLGGGQAQPLSAREANYRTLVRKRAVAARAIQAGEVLTMEAITFKRANDGAYANELERLLGRALTRPLDADDPITDACVMTPSTAATVQ